MFVLHMAHGRKWYDTIDEDLRHFKQTPVPKQWYMFDNFGIKLHPSTDKGTALSRFDAFLICFPVEQMKLMLIILINIQLIKKRKLETTEDELIKFFGILVLMTRFRCRNH